MRNKSELTKCQIQNSGWCHSEPFGFAQGRLRRGLWHRKRDASSLRPDVSTPSRTKPSPFGGFFSVGPSACGQHLGFLVRDCARHDRWHVALNRRAFTLIELLVVISIIVLLMAILIPVLGRARELGQRAVCLSNLRQLTLAWVAYADQYDSKIVLGGAFCGSGARPKLRGWVGFAFLLPESRSEMMHNADKGALWPYIRDIDIYRCPRGRASHAVTYTTVVAANGFVGVEGTYLPGTGGREFDELGKRVGSTVLKLTKLTDIISPGAGQRAVFIDMGQTPTSADFYVHYLRPKWYRTSAPPIHHFNGTTLSMADGHVEYWRWKGRETVNMPRKLMPFREYPNLFYEMVDGPAVPGWQGYEPQTEDGLYDLQRLQKATWGRLGY